MNLDMKEMKFYFDFRFICKNIKYNQPPQQHLYIDIKTDITNNSDIPNPVSEPDHATTSHRL